jgi:hypothetical protein
MFLRGSLINCKLASMIARSSDTNFWSSLSRSLLVTKETKLKSTIAENRERLPLCAIYLFNCHSAPYKKWIPSVSLYRSGLLNCPCQCAPREILECPLQHLAFTSWPTYRLVREHILPREILLLLGLCETKTHQPLQSPWPAVLQSIFTVPGHKGLEQQFWTAWMVRYKPQCRNSNHIQGQLWYLQYKQPFILNQSTTTPLPTYEDWHQAINNDHLFSVQGMNESWVRYSITKNNNLPHPPLHGGLPFCIPENDSPCEGRSSIPVFRVISLCLILN